MAATEPIPITFLYFDSCPNWRNANASIAEAATLEGIDLLVTYRTVDTREEAQSLGFRGSPTILIDGEDPFADEDSPVGLSCRIYRDDGLTSGSPSIAQLRQAFAVSGRIDP